MNFGKIIQYKKKSDHPLYINNQLPLSTRVYCMECEWESSVAESLAANPENDTCPRCGNTALTYEI